VRCEEARRFRDTYLALELTDEQALDFEAHVNECESCWHELVELRDLGLDLDDPGLQHMVMAQPSPLPDDFTARLISHVEAEQPRGLNVVWPWLRQRWSQRQIASAAYAMSATAVVISAGELLYLWNQTTDRLGVLAIQTQAYWDATMAHASGFSAYLMAAWQWITHFV
jgi:hypothetical protein